MCNFGLTLLIIDGIADTSEPTCFGKHSRNCCSKSGVNPNSYDWEGKELTKNKPKEELPKDEIIEKENCDPNIMVPAKKAKQCIDVREEMKARLVALATSNLTVIPKALYDACRAEMDRIYPSGWIGLEYYQATKLVQNTRSALNFGDPISTVENTLEYSKMSDSACPSFKLA